MQQRLVHHHLCVQPGVAGDHAGQLAVVQVSPVHPAEVVVAVAGIAEGSVA